jgi:predicted DNA-binding transcriptional regulator AlpA
MTQARNEGFHGLTAEDLLRLPPTIDVGMGGQAFGIGRTTAYQLARKGQFPCRIIRAGRACRVVTADLLRVLGLSAALEPATDSVT